MNECASITASKTTTTSIEGKEKKKIRALKAEPRSLKGGWHNRERQAACCAEGEEYSCLEACIYGIWCSQLLTALLQLWEPFLAEDGAGLGLQDDHTENDLEESQRGSGQDEPAVPLSA
jgi:hypothetical protein